MRWSLVRLGLAVATIPVLLWACTAHELSAPAPDPEQETDAYYEVNPVRDVDLLFVIDNSGSTDNKQKNFTDNFPAFMRKLEGIPGGLPNVRIGVVTSDIGAGGVMTNNGCKGSGDGGRFQTTTPAGMDCGLQPGQQWLVANNGNTQNNLMPGRTLEQVFSCMATRGSKGCGFEHQLQAASVALNPRPDWNPMNKGFLRDNAYLAIVLLTDEDDCSGPDNAGAFFGGAPPAGFVDNARCAAAGHLCNGAPVPGMDFSVPLANCKANPTPNGLLPVDQIVKSIKALKGGRDEKIIIGAIAGWPPAGQEAAARYTLRRGNGGVDLSQTCTVAGGGTPGLRIRSFVDSFTHGTLQTVCQPDFTGALEAIADLIKAVVGSPCITAPLVDTDSKAMGVQPDCVVLDRVTTQFGTADETALPLCSSGLGKPCWSLQKADMECPISGFAINVDRGGKMPAPGVQQVIRCLTCTSPTDPRCKHN